MTDIGSWAKGRRGRLLLSAAFVCATLSVAGTGAFAAARTPVSVDTSQGFARIVFELADKPRAKTEIAYDVVLITFDTPVDIDTEALRQALGQYVSVVKLDPDGKTLRIAMQGPVRLDQNSVGRQLAIDLIPPPYKGDPPDFVGRPSDDPVVRDAAAAPIPSEAGERAEYAEFAAPAKLVSVNVHAGEQPTLTRVSIDWPEFVDYTLDQQSGTVVLRFGKPARADLSELRINPPRYLKTARAEVATNSLSLVFDVAKEVEAKDFRDGNRIVMDLVPKAPANTTPEASAPGPAFDDKQAIAEGAAQVSAALAAGVRPPEAVADPHAVADIVKPGGDARAILNGQANLVPPPVAAPPAEPVAAAIPKAEAAVAAGVSGASPDATVAPVQTMAEATPVPVASVGVASAVVEPEAVTLTFPFSAPVAGAVFKRGDTVWCVFETAEDQSVAALSPNTNPALASFFSSVTDTLEGGVRVLRLGIKTDRPLEANVVGNNWVVRFADQTGATPQAVTVMRDLTDAGKPRLSFSGDVAGAHWLVDPALGDSVVVATVNGASHALVAERRFIELTALTTAAGLALTPASDNLAISAGDGSVVVTGTDGLVITSSEMVERGQIHSPVELMQQPGWVDYAQWRDPKGIAGYTASRQRLQNAIAGADDKTRDLHRIDLARYLLANGFAAEANGVLTMMGREDKRLESAPAWHALKGVALLELGRAKEAQRELRHVTLANDPDIAIWRAMAAAGAEDWTAAAESFESAEFDIPSYPADLQTRFHLAGALTALNRADATGAERMLAAVPDDGLSRAQKVTAAYLHGRLLEVENRGAEALAQYDEALKGARGPDHARAQLARAKLAVALGKTSLADASKDLTSLQYDWRGDTIELQTLATLGEFDIKDGRYREGLTTLRAAVKHFAKDDAVPAINQEMVSIFKTLFLDGAAQTLQPVEALGLYYDFRELTPIGREGDEMIRLLAERLVTVDLLSQAEELLQHQVDNRLQGAARSQVAIRLATLYLMDHKDEQALKVVRDTHQAQLPDWLTSQRRLLEARALTDLKQFDFALEVLLDDNSPDAERIRADVYWGAENWRAAAEHIEAVLGMRWDDPAPLDPQERFNVLRAAVAYHFSKDAFGIDQIRARYASLMKNTPDQAAFELVTAKEPSAGSDLREVTKRLAATDTLDAFMKSFSAHHGAESKTADGASATN